MLSPISHSSWSSMAPTRIPRTRMGAHHPRRRLRATISIWHGSSSITVPTCKLRAIIGRHRSMWRPPGSSRYRTVSRQARRQRGSPGLGRSFLPHLASSKCHLDVAWFRAWCKCGQLVNAPHWLFFPFPLPTPVVRPRYLPCLGLGYPGFRALSQAPCKPLTLASHLS